MPKLNLIRLPFLRKKTFVSMCTKRKKKKKRLLNYLQQLIYFYI